MGRLTKLIAEGIWDPDEGLSRLGRKVVALVAIGTPLAILAWMFPWFMLKWLILLPILFVGGFLAFLGALHVIGALLEWVKKGW